MILHFFSKISSRKKSQNSFCHKDLSLFLQGVQLGLAHFDHKTKKHHSVLFRFIVVLAERTLLFACENGVRLAISDTPRTRASSEVRLAKWTLCTGA